jgi:hypothetical protein
MVARRRRMQSKLALFPRWILVPVELLHFDRDWTWPQRYVVVWGPFIPNDHWPKGNGVLRTEPFKQIFGSRSHACVVHL